MSRFEVHGPFKVPFQANAGGKAITSKEAKAFWMANPAFARSKGCYIFAIKASKGMKPLYVGKATRTFAGEVFTPHKLAKYMTALSYSKKGTPLLFLLCHPTGKGATNKSNIDDLESFLIQEGMRANPQLVNERKTRPDAWSIAGVLRDGRGKPSRAAQDLKRLLNR